MPAQAESAQPEAGHPGTVLEIENLSKTFGALRAVDGIDFSVDDEFFAFLGPSGSGKTTTLRMIAGLEAPDSGRIALEGREITFLPPEKRNIHTVFQSYALFPHMTVAENVAFGLKRKRLSKHYIREEVTRFLALVDLSEKAESRPRELSGGEKQRVALVRALINRPKLLLLDEPLGALDLKIRQKLAIDLVNIREEVNISFVYVTHDQTEALTMADRIAVMDKGRILQVGGPKELYENPCCGFVARFIGNTNILEGRVTERDGKLVKVALPGLSDVWGMHAGSGIAGRSRVNVSVRPEKIRISRTSRKEPGYNELLGVVREIIYVGPSTEFLVELKSTDCNQSKERPPGAPTGSDCLFRVFAQNTSPENEIWKITWDEHVYLSFRFDRTLVLGN